MSGDQYLGNEPKDLGRKHPLHQKIEDLVEAMELRKLNAIAIARMFTGME